MNDDYIVWKGSRFDFQVTTDEEDAVSITLALKDADDNNFEFTEPVVDGVADFQDSDVTDLAAAEYEYQIYENYATGNPTIFPDTDKCEGECELPTITICEAIEVS